MAQPHFVRFAQALALVTGLAGCGSTTTPPAVDAATTDDAATSPDAAVIADAGNDAASSDASTPRDTSPEPDARAMDDAGQPEDAFVAVTDAGTFDCSMCTCFPMPGSSLRECVGEEIFTCSCAAVGPLAPPDLVV